MDRYKKLKQIGEGSYGKVYKSKSIDHNAEVAIKRVPVDKENGISFTTMREIRILRDVKSPYLVKGLDMMYEEGYIFIVMEYMEYDLTGLLQSKYVFEKCQINSLIYQLLQGLSFLHSLGFIHRDVKASNILLNRQGQLKLIDFSLTREHSSFMTNRVCTLWYRAPELLLGETNYNDRVDSWAVGCLMVEMGFGQTPFKGNNEVSQTKIIFDKLGPPSQEYRWINLFNLQKYRKKETFEELIYKHYGEKFDENQLALLKELLCLDSKRRISAKHALKMTCLLEQKDILFPIINDEVHEFSYKNKPKE